MTGRGRQFWVVRRYGGTYVLQARKPKLDVCCAHRYVLPDRYIACCSAMFEELTNIKLKCDPLMIAPTKVRLQKYDGRGKRFRVVCKTLAKDVLLSVRRPNQACPLLFVGPETFEELTGYKMAPGDDVSFRLVKV